MVSGPIDPRSGWVLDFAVLQSLWAPVHAALDHRVLNDVSGLENPTSERLAVWIWHALAAPLQDRGLTLASLSVSETGGFQVTYRGG